MFDFSKQGSIFIITAAGVRIHECHSKTIATEIVSKLSSGELLRDILASNIENLAKIEKRKQQIQKSKTTLSSETLNSKLKQSNVDLKKAQSKIIELQNEVRRLSTSVKPSLNLEKNNQFRKDITSELYKTIIGSYNTGATIHLWELTPKEIIQLIYYIAIFNKHNYKEHWQVNELITNQNAWDQFDALRSNNRHSNDFVAKGIYPKYFALVCEILNISGDGGSPLVKANRY